MGSKKILLAVLVLIVLSASVSAVGFEWALGYPEKIIGHNPPDTWSYQGRIYLNINPDGQYLMWQGGDAGGGIRGMIDDTPLIAIKTSGVYYARYDCDGTKGDRCQQYFSTQTYYKGQQLIDALAIAHTSLNFPYYVIADEIKMRCAHVNYKCTRRCPDERCQDRTAYALHYAPILARGFDSVFPKEYTQSLGTVSELLKEDYVSNTTVYVGLFMDNYGDLLYWFSDTDDSNTDYPADAKKETKDDDFLLVCTDLDHNAHCDYTQANVQTCWTEQGDWYARGEHEACCAEKTALRPEIPGIETFNCTYFNVWLNAICGYDNNDNYYWAPLSEPGVVTNLLGCPGYTVVSNRTKSKYCAPATGTIQESSVTVQAVPHALYWPWARWHWRLESSHALFGHYQPGILGGTREFTNLRRLLHFYRAVHDATNADAAARMCSNGPIPGVYHPAIAAGTTAYFSAGASSDWPILNCPFKAPLIDPMSASIEIGGALGTHEYICDGRTGYVFECAGEVGSYTNPLTHEINVAPIGRSTADIVGVGGCPPHIEAYWSFDDNTARDIKKDFIGEKYGVIDFDGTLPDDPDYQPTSVDNLPNLGKAFEFDGTDFINLPSNFSVPGDTLTVEAWVRPKAISGEQKIIEKEDSFILKISGAPGASSGTLRAAINTGAGMTLFGVKEVYPDTWYHVAIVYDGSKAILYVNGRSAGHISISGDVQNNALPFVIGESFVGVIDEVAIYSTDIFYLLLAEHSKKPPKPYCGAGQTAFAQNLYCASDADWTPDLDIKDVASCNAAGFGWTGHYCCSEDDDDKEYYSDFDAPPAPFNYERLFGKILETDDTGEPTKFELDANGNKVTIIGPAKFQIKIYSQERIAGQYSLCKGGFPIYNKTIVLKTGDRRTIKLTEPQAEIPDPGCKYRLIEIESLRTESGGGCWDKRVIPLGELPDPKVVNYKGTFYGCDLRSGNPLLALKNNRTNTDLFTSLTLKDPDCSMLQYARLGADKPHAVCTPSGVWKFVADPDATENSSIRWDVAEYNVTGVTRIGCCRPDQCWTGFECVDIGEYHTVDGDSYYCKE